nr:hypothetical protein Itr_chr02CG10020 [Ipomoea trifida]
MEPLAKQLWMWRPRTSDDGRRRSLPASDVQQQGLPQQPWPLAPSFSLGVSAARTCPSASPARRAKNGIPSSDGATQRSSKHGHPSPRSTGAASVGWRASVDGGDSGVEATAGDLAVATTELLIGIHPLCFRRSGRAVEVDGSPLLFGVL